MDQEGQSAQTNKINFGRYVLDLSRGCLLSDGREIPLRPKTFSVLTYLAQRPGQLVSKDELFEAVWPGLVVGDDTLVQSIGELRRALSDADAKLITTVPRRGYRLEADAAPTERRRARGVQPLRFRWKYGLFAPLALAIAFAAIWLATSRDVKPTRAADDRPAIAILPFQNQSEDPGREYLADGLTQDLINSLGRFSELTVMSWNAVATYKGAIVQPGEIARVLAVRYQVEGSVRFADDRLRVSAQLVDVQGRVLWSARYDEAAADVFTLQDRITREVAGALAIRVSEQEQKRVAAKPPASFDAYDYLLRGRLLLQRPSRAGIVEARELLRKALAIDPGYGAAHAALGETFHAAVSLGWAEDPDDYWKRVEKHAGDALRVDPNNVQARVLLGRLNMAYNRYAAAELEMDRAVAINPNNADALAGRGNGLLWMGRSVEAIEWLELAQRIDPELNPYERFALAMGYYLKKRYDDAIEQCVVNLRKSPESTFNLPVLAASYAQTGRKDDAERTVATLHAHDPTFDAKAFGNKFQDAGDLEHLRAGMRKAGLLAK
ncbi:MAG TPA: winged helix-turn-helix domain-containing protein [Steroidobacteraceae bacterium]|nr:winged helix-turn-helix domain-containing protein [Steroidobacteraceae bacterium]